MKKNIATVISVVMLSVLMLCTFAACSDAENNATSGNWSANWDNFRPGVVKPTIPDADGPSGETPDTEEGDGTEDLPTVVPPALPPIKYSSMIKSNTQSLNIRSAPSTSASVLGSMDKGDMLRYEGMVNGWYKTVYKQKTAYIYAGSNYAHIVEMKQSSDDKIERIISVGEELMGYPYVWGSQRYHWGNGVLNSNFVQGEFDCSALMQYIFFKGAGILMDLNTRTQVLQGKKVADGDLRRGDVMFFTNASRYNNTGVERVGHVALYLGNNYILHTASDHVVIEEISSTRWGYFLVAKRF